MSDIFDGRASYLPAVDTQLVDDSTIGSVLRAAAEQAPEVIALVEGVQDRRSRRRWTYAELLVEAERAAGALLERFEPGERVAVWANNIPEWVLLQMGAALAGLVLVTVDPALRAAELRHVLGQSAASGVFLRREYRGNPMAEHLDEVRAGLPALREVVLFDDWAEFVEPYGRGVRLPRVLPGDPAQIQYTSGTTGAPKGAVLRHTGLVNNVRLSYARYLGVRPGDAMLNTMPLFHTAGSVLATLSPILLRATHVLMPFFDPALYLRLVAEERSVIFGGVPTMVRTLLDHPDLPHTDLSSVRVALVGGATAPAELVRRAEEALGVPMGIIYAQTEASPGITMTRPFEDTAEDRASTLGRPLPATDVSIVSTRDGRTTVPVGEVGELRTRGYHVMIGYHDDPVQTAATIDEDGWLHTGDLASMDSRGYCRIEGRLKEMIIRGGENIFPREVEDVLLTHPGVQDLAVVGVPDAHWGEQVAAFVRAHPGTSLSDEDLAEFCRSRLAPHKVPRIWRFVDRFPVTTSGKIQKFALRAQLPTNRSA